MGSQIVFFRKSYADLEVPYVTITASEGQENAIALRDRSNRTAWGTTGSSDAANTTLEIDLVDVVTIDSILLLKHNFKNFLLETWDVQNSVYVYLVHPTTCTDASSYFNFTARQTSKLKITIYGTQVADADKILYQLIVTAKVGQLEGWPVIGRPVMSRNVLEQKMLSGKSHIQQNVGFYAASLVVANWSSAADLAIVERLFGASEGFLYWPCGGDESQFRSVRQGYRLEDLFLVRCKNEYSPEFVKGLYKSGLKMQIDLVEVIT